MPGTIGSERTRPRSKKANKNSHGGLLSLSAIDKCYGGAKITFASANVPKRATFTEVMSTDHQNAMTHGLRFQA